MIEGGFKDFQLQGAPSYFRHEFRTEGDQYKYQLSAEVPKLGAEDRAKQIKALSDKGFDYITRPVMMGTAAFGNNVPFPITNVLAPFAMAGKELLAGLLVVPPVYLLSQGQSSEAASSFVDTGAGILKGLAGGIAITSPLMIERNRTPIQETMGIAEVLEPENLDALSEVEFLIDQLNQRSDVKAESFEETVPRAIQAVDAFMLKYEGRTINTVNRVKTSRLSTMMMRRLNAEAFYNPVFGEIVFSKKDRPETIGHEVAHAKGRSSETQAEIIGIASQIESDDTWLQYLGYRAWLGRYRAIIDGSIAPEKDAEFTSKLEKTQYGFSSLGALEDLGLNQRTLKEFDDQDKNSEADSEGFTGIGWILKQGVKQSTKLLPKSAKDGIHNWFEKQEGRLFDFLRSPDTFAEDVLTNMQFKMEGQENVVKAYIEMPILYLNSYRRKYLSSTTESI